MRERTIIFATDLEQPDDAGIALATRLSAQSAATLVFAHVSPLRTADGEGMLHDAVDLVTSSAGPRLRALAPSAPGVPYRHRLLTGDPFSELVSLVAQEGAMLLVMAAPRPRLMRRLVGGGLVSRLQQRADCPVVTYRPGADGASRPSRPLALSHSTAALTALLDARVDALLVWMAQQRAAVSAMAARPSIRAEIARRVLGRRVDSHSHPPLTQELQELLQAIGAQGVELLASPCSPSLVRIGRGARQDAVRLRWLQQLSRTDSSLSLPLESDAPDDGCVILAGVSVPIPDAPPALLVFTLDAQRDFLRILAQPGPVPSAETYAFDAEGMMLSYSRFPDQLRQIGLLPSEPGAQTPRRLRVCDPGGNLLRGEGSHSAARPLTRMAVAATAGEDGSDWSGYRDYRGVPVVGAWRWLPALGLGIAAEMDAVRYG